MRTFIAFTDFSKNARYASEYAVQLAMKRNASLKLIHVFENPVAVSEYELTTIHFHNMEERILRQLEERKQELIDKYGDQVSITCQTFNRYLVERMRQLFTDPDVKLAIIGLTGSGMTNFFLGSNTLDIVEHSGCIVMTVPPHSVFRPIKNIVFACNMEDMSATIPVKKIKKISALFDAQLYVLHVMPREIPDEELKQKEAALAELLQDIPYSFHTVRNRNIFAGIKDFSKEIKADLITIIPGKHDFWGRLLQVNHTKTMLFRSDIPILSIGEKEE